MKKYPIYMVAVAFLICIAAMAIRYEPANSSKASSVVGIPKEGASNHKGFTSFSTGKPGTVVFITDNPDPTVRIGGKVISVEALGDPLSDDSGLYRFAIVSKGGLSVSVGKGHYLAYTRLE